jgi:hypothetical protein
MEKLDYHYSLGHYLDLSVDLPDFLNIKERFKHLYLVGLSGMGKSTVMENLAEYDISQGYSVIFIDPKGDSSQKLYYNFRDNPKVRYVTFDNPLTINLFDKDGYDFDTLIDEFVQIMDNVITATSSNQESTVRMKEIFYYALSSLQPEDMNFNKLYQFLTYRDFRQNYHYTDYEFLKWWENLFNSKKTDYKKRADYEVTMSSIASRIHQAMRNKQTNVFINGDNELDIDDLIKNGNSLIINIKTSNDFVKVFIANLIVSSILSFISMKKKTKPLFVYIDEFDLVASGSFAKSLQLARSSFVGFTLAHQTFSSAKSEAHARMMNAIIDSILGAVSNYLVFNTSPTVAKTMCDVFNLKISDFTELGNYEARLRLGTKKFLIQTRLPVLVNIPDDYLFPSVSNKSSATTLDFLSDEWIML